MAMKERMEEREAYNELDGATIDELTLETNVHLHRARGNGHRGHAVLATKVFNLEDNNGDKRERKGQRAALKYVKVGNIALGLNLEGVLALGLRAIRANNVNNPLLVNLGHLKASDPALLLTS